MCRIPAYSCQSYASLDFAPLTFFLSQPTTKLHFKYGPKTTCCLALVKPKRVKTCLRQGASIGALRGRLRRAPLTSRGEGRGHGFAVTTSALVGSSVLEYDAASTHCTG